MIGKSTYKLQTAAGNWQHPLLLFVFVVISVSCEKWNDTADVSHISQLPRFEITGGDFVSYIVSDTLEYDDPGAYAYEGDKPLDVYAFGEADLSKAGVYIIYYWAQNSDGLSSIGERVIAVTNEDISDNNLSGLFEGTLWSPLLEMEVTKLNDYGLYKCTEVFGYPGIDMPGRFVDLGNNELVLLHGEGDFGRYAQSEGSYTLSTLSWTIGLLDEPYNGITIDVLWRKTE